jgi:hypothetical protein
MTSGAALLISMACPRHGRAETKRRSVRLARRDKFGHIRREPARRGWLSKGAPHADHLPGAR